MQYTQWCREMLSLIQKVGSKAQRLWDTPLQDGEIIRPQTLHEQTGTDQNVIGLFKAISNSDAVTTPSGSLTVEEQEMNIKLGLWLCSYFLSVPRPDLWSDVTSLAFHSGGYPEGAFYLKLAGDAFRFERRQWDKAKFRNELEIKRQTMSWQKDGILVMAYSPLLLVPDSGRCSDPSDEAQYGCEVRRLALNYVRIQQRAYIRSGYPIRYVVSRGSACEALAQALLNKTDEERRMQSNSTLKKYFPQGAHSLTPKQEVLVVAFGLTRRRGLTSCVLASEDGVISSLPNRFQARNVLCTWVEGRPLIGEREKLCSLWDQYKQASETGKKQEPDPDAGSIIAPAAYDYFLLSDSHEPLKDNDKENFAQKWYDEKIAKRLVKERTDAAASGTEGTETGGAEMS